MAPGAIPQCGTFIGLGVSSSARTSEYYDNNKYCLFPFAYQGDLGTISGTILLLLRLLVSGTAGASAFMAGIPERNGLMRDSCGGCCCHYNFVAGTAGNGTGAGGGGCRAHMVLQQ
jgi:hypothetical protein